MKRRSFLKFLGISSAAPIAAKAAEHLPENIQNFDSAPDGFDPVDDVSYVTSEVSSLETEWGMACSAAAEPVYFRDLKKHF